MAGAAAAPNGPVHVAAAAPITLPHLPPDRRRNGAAAYPGLRRRPRSGMPDRPRRAASHFRRRSGGSGGCRGIRRGRVLRRRSCAGNFRSPGGRRRPPRRRSVPRTRRACRLRGALHRSGVRRGGVLRRRSCRRNAPACAPPAWRPRRVMAVQRFLHQPPQQLPRRHLRVDVGQQPLELLQPTLAVVIDVVFDRGQFLDPLQQMVVGEGGDGGGNRRAGRCVMYGPNITM